jgi:hypothetical protein
MLGAWGVLDALQCSKPEWEVGSVAIVGTGENPRGE